MVSFLTKKVSMVGGLSVIILKELLTRACSGSPINLAPADAYRSMEKMKIRLKRLSMRSAWVAGLMLLTVLIPYNIHAESWQTPSPPQGTVQNKESATKQQVPSRDYNGTEQSPPAVKILKTQKDDGAASNQKSERGRKANIELGTIVIAVITAIILLFQLFVFGRQARRLKETIEEMKLATRATQEAANAATAQAAVATKEFISTHRPRLIVRSVTIKPYTHPAVPIEEGKPIQIEWAVVNVGASPAEIIESNATILVGDKSFHARTPYSPARDHMNGIKLVPGGAFTFVLPSEQVDFQNDSHVFSLIQGEKVVYFFGFIMYRDDIGNVRRTAFCRRYIPDAERFVAVDDPDYEYTD